MLKGKGAKLKGLWEKAIVHGSQLPKEVSFLFATGYSFQSFRLMEEIFSELSLKRSMISMLQKKSGIDTHAVNRFLNEIKTHHTATYWHSINVARLSAQLAYKLKLTVLELYIISIGALLHDVGKTSGRFAALIR